uniref:Family with sequence similarity 185 member A n=1 Tax=Neolamprologus brichardi TaxID=32507 RepID=A0A3Q4G3K7_NEOBR
MFWGSAGQRASVGLLRCWSLTVSPYTLTPTRCPLHTPRSLSFSAPLKSPAHEEVKQPLRRWDLSVSPFTTVRAQIGCNISINPLDPHTYPEADRAFITVHGPDKEQEVSLDRLKVHYDDRSKELLISAETVGSDLSIEMSAPIKSSECVYVRNMECDICKVRTEKGNCLLHSVKAVDVKKLQGTKMNVSTEHGPLKVKAIYAESTCISSRSGRVNLGHVHGKHTLQEQLYLTQLSLLHLLSHIVFLLLENNTSEGHTTVIGYMNVESPANQWVKAQADRGSIRLTVQSWFESRRLVS